MAAGVGAEAMVGVAVAVKAAVMGEAKVAVAAKAVFAAPTATPVEVVVAVAAATEPLALSNKVPHGTFSFGWMSDAQADGARCLRGRPASRRSYRAFGSRRSSLASTPMGQGTTR